MGIDGDAVIVNGEDIGKLHMIVNELFVRFVAEEEDGLSELLALSP